MYEGSKQKEAHILTGKSYSALDHAWSPFNFTSSTSLELKVVVAQHRWRAPKSRGSEYEVVSRNPRNFHRPSRGRTGKLLDALGKAAERFVHVLQCLGSRT